MLVLIGAPVQAVFQRCTWPEQACVRMSVSLLVSFVRSVQSLMRAQTLPLEGTGRTVGIGDEQLYQLSAHDA